MQPDSSGELLPPTVAAAPHHSSPITAAIHRALAPIGLDVSDRVAALVLLNGTVLLYATNW